MGSAIFHGVHRRQKIAKAEQAALQACSRRALLSAGRAGRFRCGCSRTGSLWSVGLAPERPGERHVAHIRGLGGSLGFSATLGAARPSELPELGWSVVHVRCAVAGRAR